ncbi:MAG TPA: FtsH protease activity modulator HflK [Gammaproteobacteria bacterium]|nr:FtsH protease activity modulator HflK [Gammaproteobacteria bacterium]
MVWNEPGKNNDKDPWGNGEHSPDLERLVKTIRQRLRTLFGGKRPGRKGLHAVTLLWVVPLLVIAWLVSGFYTIAAGDRGVPLSFGRAGAIMQPGLHWNYPWPIGTQVTVTGVDQGRDYTHLYNQLVTEDGSVVVVAAQVHYQISDIRDYLFKVAAPGSEDTGSRALFNALADSAIRIAVARSTLAGMLGNGRDQAEAEAHDLLQTALRHNEAGIAVTRLVFQRVDVPDVVSSAYEDVRKAKQDAQQLQDDAQVYANRVVAEAKGTGDADVTEADAYRVTRTSVAQADVARFDEILGAYRAEPALTRDQLYLQAMEDVLGKVNKVVVDTHNGNVSVQFTQSTAHTAVTKSDDGAEKKSTATTGNDKGHRR